VRGGIRRHLLEPPAGAVVAVSAASSRRSSTVEALDQVVADLLQLGHVGHVSLGAEEGMGGLAGLSRIGRVCGELRLEVRDLAAKLPAPEPLVGLDRRHLAVRRRSGQIRPGRVDRPGEVPGVDATLPGALDGLGREALEIRRARGIVGDERPEAMARGNQPVVLEPAVDGARGVDVHTGAARELTHAGEAVTWAELAACDQDAQSPRELRAERQVVGASKVRRQVGGRLCLCLRGLCHCTSTLALTVVQRQGGALLRLSLAGVTERRESDPALPVFVQPRASGRTYRGEASRLQAPKNVVLQVSEILGGRCRGRTSRCRGAILKRGTGAI
jgi:hypothetical protein